MIPLLKQRDHLHKWRQEGLRLMIKWLLMLIAILVVFGCARHDENAEAENGAVNSEQKGKGMQAIKEEEKEVDQYINNPQAPDTRSLKEIGDTYEDEDGKVTLVASTDDSKRLEIGPIELTYKNLKVMEYRPALHLIDYFHQFTHHEDRFNYLKLQVKIQNKSEQTINVAPVSVLETSEGELKGFEDDFYLQELHGKLSPGQVKTGELAYILEKSDPEQLNSISITTSDVYEDNKQQAIEKGKKVELAF